MTIFPSVNMTGLFAGETHPAHDTITLAAGQNAAGAVVPRGTVLGLVTASGKAVIATAAATDGSQTPSCILADDVDTSAGDVVCPAYFTGAFADVSLNFGAGLTAATVDAAFRAKNQSIFIKMLGLVP